MEYDSIQKVNQYIDATVESVCDMYYKDEIECNEMYEIFINDVTEFVHKNTEYDCVILEHDYDYNTIQDTIDNFFFELKGKTIVDYMTATINGVFMIVVLINKGA